MQLPSILFENWAWDYRVLRLWARHDVTGSVIPRAVVERLRRSRRAFFAVDVVAQAKQALFDQRLFGGQRSHRGRAAERLMDDIHARFPVARAQPRQTTAHGQRPWLCADAPPTLCCAVLRWVQLFAAPGSSASSFLSSVHLCHYGAGYYSYLMCRVYAQATWALLFADDPLSRRGGERYTEAVLRHGGAREPHLILQSLFGQDLHAPLRHFLQHAEREEEQQQQQQQPRVTHPPLQPPHAQRVRL